MNQQPPLTETGQRRKTVVVAAVLGLITLTLAVFWPGYDAQDVPPENPELWVLRSGAAEQYGRVNTEVLELETIKPAANPTSVLQQGHVTVLFADGNRRFTVINSAMPSDLSEDEDDQWLASPPDTRRVQLGGGTLLFTTDNGALFTSNIASPDAFIPINPDAVDPEDLEDDQQPPVFLADAATITDEGTVLAVVEDGPEEIRIIKADGTTGNVTSDKTAIGNAGGRAQVALVDDKWVLLNRADGELWVEGRTAAINLESDLTPTLRGSGSGQILVADMEGLLEVTGDGTVDRIITVAAGSVPAQPKQIDGVVYGAWLPEGESGGTLWDSETEQTSILSYAGLDLPGDPDPRITTNGSRHAVTDTKSGWVWLLPSGELVRSSQAWSVDDDIVEEVITAEVQEATEPKPPVAMPDVFGVRAGSETVLPVLLNDYDANNDVLSIDPSSITGLDPEFGTVTTSNNMQQLVVNVSETATGSATFKYQVTDGTAEGGLLSNPATVTLSVAPDDSNGAPVWCGVEECLATWPSPTTAPGETLSVNVLEAWVDPDGDPLFLSAVGNPTGAGTAVANPDGTLTYKADQPEGGGTENVPLEVTVSDTAGQSTTRVMNVRVSPEAPLEFTPKVALGVVGQPLTVNLEDAITGGQGAVRLVEASPTDSEAVEVAPSSSALRFALTADQPGSYPVRVMVEDGSSEATGTVRVVLMEEEDTQVTASPVTVFVRPNEDVTVDILPAVTNPAGHVLLVDQLGYEPAGESELTADVLGQRYIHASGTTETGEPGLLGHATYHVSDGTGAANAAALGEITFMLLPDADSAYPIAGDRHVTVNAGSQVDFPVLEWAVAPAGSQISVDAATVTNETEGGLAFGTQTLVRYLAPDEPGEYAVSYSIYRLGDPNLRSTGRLHIQVVEPDPEAKPRPTTLEGRVLAGRQVSVRPDYQAAAMQGETIRLSAVTEQPAKGSAAVSADGETLVYTADPESTGQDKFTYEVVTPTGQKTSAQVKIGILDAQIVPAPVTFSDYVQMAVGSDSEVAVYPTNNDTDPLGEGLELVDVTPNAPMGSEEYAELDRRIRSVDTETGEVRLLAGNQVGTSSFIYTARGPNGDTATGLIITKVVRERVLDVPAVSDTVLTAETLAQLPIGVDVLDGKVQWVGGDASILSLSMWDSAMPYEALGPRIKGPVPDAFTVVPFEVEGTTFLGEEATSFGFLKVPTEKEVHLALREVYQEIEVDEGESATVNLAQAIAIPKDEKLVVDGSKVAASGVRMQARCSVAGDTLTYEAGDGAPWRDSCVVPAKTESQDTFTHLSIAVKVVPRDPQPTLIPASITVSPGTTQTYDLQQMVEWDGDPNWASLQFATHSAGQLFEVTQAGSQLTVRAKDDAKPTRTEPVSVSLTTHGDAGAATLQLVVGPRPSLMPRGGTVSQECTQAGGKTSCTIAVRGAAGQLNPFPNTPLKLVEAISPADCAGVKFEVADETTVKASWSADTPGGMCKGGFVMQDAQETRTMGEGAGIILLDLQGLPAAPTSLTWTAYGPDSVTLKADLAGTSYPEVSELTWAGDGKSGKCSLESRECVITGLPVGVDVEYTVHAVNAVGKSKAGASVNAWAYEPPDPPTLVDWKPEKGHKEGGVISLTLDPADGTKSITVTRGDKVLGTAEVGSGPVHFNNLQVGNTPTSITATPKSKHPLPVGAVPGASEGASLTVRDVYGVGAPTLKNLEAVAAENKNEITVSFDVASDSPRARTETIVSVTGAQPHERTVNGTGSSSLNFAVPYGSSPQVMVTATNWLGDENYGQATLDKTVSVGVPLPTWKTVTYTLDTEGVSSGAGYEWNTGDATLSASCAAGLTVKYAWGGLELDGGVGENLPVTQFPKAWCVAENGISAETEKKDFARDGPYSFSWKHSNNKACPANFPTESQEAWEAWRDWETSVFTTNFSRPTQITATKRFDRDIDPTNDLETELYIVKVELHGYTFPEGRSTLEWQCRGKATDTSTPPSEDSAEE